MAGYHLRTWPVLLLIFAICGGADKPDSVDLPPKQKIARLAKLPSRGPIPPIVKPLALSRAEADQFQAEMRRYTRQIHKIRREHFGSIRVDEIRQRGIALLGEFTDPAAFDPMIELLLVKEKDDVRLAVLDQFAAHGDDGQAALARVAITSKDAAMRAEAIRRMVTPAPEAVLRELDIALRSRTHETANNAGALAGALNVIETIPLLAFAQQTQDRVPENKGDLAWIAIETQKAYIADLWPIVGGESGAYQPIIGVVHEGVVLRVMDAVVVVYRTEIHTSLVAMSSYDWGDSTEPLGYDMGAWWRWYNEQYVPYKNEQAELAEFERQELQRQRTQHKKKQQQGNPPPPPSPPTP